jgi:hypothetical protein
VPALNLVLAGILEEDHVLVAGVYRVRVLYGPDEGLAAVGAMP